jgi:hypothetical protein
VAVGEDVRGVEQFDVAQVANRARASVGVQHALSEDCLVQATLGDAAVVRPPRVLGDSRAQVGGERLGLGDRHGERQARRVVTDDEHRPRRQVMPLRDPLEVHQRNVLRHRLAQPGVLAMCHVRAAVAVAEQAIRRDLVFVRSDASLDDRRRADAERHRGQDRGLEDPLLADERDPATLEVEAVV